ncbi:MAG: hypothetical protein PHN74_00130 [Candidatus Pacebacteria bacterium]|nr:hypothetical protein [Candidatus Paceibacterota bacterium]
MKKHLILAGIVFCLFGFFGILKSANAYYCYPNPVGDCFVNCKEFKPGSEVKVYNVAKEQVRGGTYFDANGDASINMSGLSSGTYYVIYSPAEYFLGIFQTKAAELFNLSKIGGEPKCYSTPLHTDISIYKNSSKEALTVPAAPGTAFYFESELKSFLNSYITNKNFNFSYTLNSTIQKDPINDTYIDSYDSNRCFSPCDMGYPSCRAGYTEVDRRELTRVCGCEHRITCSKNLGFQNMIISGYGNVVSNTSNNTFNTIVSATDSDGHTASANAVIPLTLPPQQIKATGSVSFSSSSGSLKGTLTINGVPQGLDYAILRSNKVSEKLAKISSNYYIPPKNDWGYYINSCVGGGISLPTKENILPSAYKAYSIFQDSKTTAIATINAIAGSSATAIGNIKNSRYQCGTDWGGAPRYCNCPNNFTVLPSSSSLQHTYSINSWDNPGSVSSSNTGNSFIDVNVDYNQEYAYIIKVPATDRDGYITTYSDPITGETPNVPPAPPALPSCSFSADPSMVPAHSASKITWSCQESNTCDLYEGTSKVDSGISGDYTANIGTTSKIYKLSCSGNGGLKDFSLTIKVSSIQYKEVAP